jgi:tRNA modification GTPase
MYELNDTIVAVSSPSPGQRAIVRITGPNTVAICEELFRSSIPKENHSLLSGSMLIDGELQIDAKLYLFFAPHSYTGETLAEIHIYTNPSITEVVMANLLGEEVRMAGPGEFTARAYLNGRIDLAQAEAVNEIIVSSNKYQLAAAEKLFSGRLAETTAQICSGLLDFFSLLEAGLDFSGEDIEFVTREQGVEKLAKTKERLEQLLSGGISYEEVIDLPAVGIAGAPNAGKSSLLNKLLGKERSIVSDQSKTTRDVLTSLLALRHCRCVLFDCAGLIRSPTDILDELAQQAAIEALRNSSAVVFCVDISKPDWAEDIVIRRLIEPKVMIPVATKADLLAEDELAKRLAGLTDFFEMVFLATSAEAGTGVELLKDTIDKELTDQALASAQQAAGGAVALTARHRQAVIEAIENVSESIDELKAGNDEVVTMMLRAAYQAISGIEQQNIDEQILDNIFSRFCIGK